MILMNMARAYEPDGEIVDVSTVGRVQVPEDHLGFESVFRGTGDGIRWQVFMVLMTSYTAFVASIDTFSLVFKMDAPQHLCLPPLTVTMVTNVSDPFRNQTTVCLDEDRCTCKRQYGSFDKTGNSTLVDSECSGWQYDRSVYVSTVVTQFDLVCDRAPMRSLVVSLHMFSGLVASLLFGLLGDRLGRARAGSISIVLFIVCSFLQTFCTNFPVFLLLASLTAGAHAGMYCSWYTFCMETVGDRWRSYAGIFWLLPWAIGISTVAVVAWLFRSWWQLQLFVAIASVPMLLCVFCLPESPRWLLDKGRVEEAAQGFKRIAVINGCANNFNHEDVVAQLKMTRAPLKSSWVTTNSSVCFELCLLFGSRQMLIRSAATACLWMSISMVYYGLSFDSTQLTHDAYLAMGLTGLVEVPGMAAVWLIDRWGRRPVMTLVFLLTAATILPILLVSQSWCILVFGLVSKLLLSAGFGIIYIYVEEYFPTTVRSAALGMASTAEAAGGAVAPYISFTLSQLHSTLPSVIFMLAMLAAGVVVAVALPETLGHPMPETVEEVEKSSTSRSNTHTPLTVMRCNE